MTHFVKEKRNQVRRLPNRGHYDKETIYPIVDQALICHVGFVHAAQPFVIPTLHARQGDTLLLHGATTSRLIRHAQAGHPICVTVTLVDEIVLARALFHHSINYRSAVLFGRGHLIDDPQAKTAALSRFAEKMMPGRWDDARRPNEVEMKATAVVAVDIESASAKVREGPPGDDGEDYALPVWAGVLPIRQVVEQPQADPRLSPGIGVPDYITTYVRRNGQ